MSETADLTRPLIEQLNATGGYAIRMPVGKVQKGKHWIQMCEEGTADILFFPQGLYNFRGHGHDFISYVQPVWIETKDPRGVTAKKRKQAQAKFRSKVEALGHRYIRATTIDEGLAALK